jgi:uncharacterized protein YdaU (DUF1376 family)
LHYYKRNLGDYAKKAGRLTMLQHGAYTLLIDSCYDREVFPTLEQALEWTWASTEAEIEAVKFVLSRFFVLDKDGQYVQDRILQELLEYHSKSQTNKRIAIERETKRKEKRTNRAQGVNEAPPNQEPLTINQEPINTETTSLVVSPSEKTPSAPIAEIVDLYNSRLPMLPRVTVVSDSRKRLVAARWRDVVSADKLDRERGLEFFDWFFVHVGKSKFLTGRSKDWKANFEFLFTASKFPRIVEGAYHQEQT